MLFLLSKILPLLFFPIGFACLSGAAAVVLAWKGRRRSAAFASFAGVSVLYLASLGSVSAALLRGLERQYPQSPTYPRSPAIVVLGGAGVAAMAPRIHPETNAWGDRLSYGALLYRQGLAPRIVVTGGIVPYVGSGAKSTEASINADILRIYFGVDSTALFLADESRNTREDALCVRKRFEQSGWPKEIILVTSAAHMPRSVALLRKQGFVVHPAPGDFHASKGSGHFQPVDFLPTEAALFETWYALHEYVGYAAYKALGWL
jgi:uncharacterized SAM-binding protein YcdF (DUF218 family)